MRLLALMGVLTMTTPIIAAVPQTNAIIQKNNAPLIVSDNDGYALKFRNYNHLTGNKDPNFNFFTSEINRQERVRKLYGGNTYPIFNNLKRPNTWENLWYDLLVVNGFESHANDTTQMKAGLDKLRHYLNIDDTQLELRYGELVHTRPQIMSQSVNRIDSFSFLNGSNKEQVFLTNELTKKVTTAERWRVSVGVSASYSISATINFFGLASSTSQFKFEANLKTDYEHDSQVEETLRSPSQTIILQPKTRTTLDWFLADSYFRVRGGIRYKASEKFSKDLKEVEPGIDLFPKSWDATLTNVPNIALSRSLWLIANAGPAAYFTEESNDLFIIDGVGSYNNENLPPYQLVGSAAVSYTYNIPFEYYMHGLSVEYNINSETI